MIKLDNKRNEKGLYVLENEDWKKFSISLNKRDIWSGHESFIFNNKDDKKVYIKYNSFRHYFSLCIFGELLFDKLAKDNAIACANTDVAYTNSHDNILSEDVAHGALESFDLTDLGDVVYGKNKQHDPYMREDVSYFNWGSFFETLYLENIFDILEKFTEKNRDIMLDKNIKFELFQMAICDFIVGNSDRNSDNIKFGIFEMNGKKVLKLLPLFDNEAAFSNFQLTAALYDADIQKKEVNGGVEFSERFYNALEKGLEDSKKTLSLMGFKGGAPHLRLYNVHFNDEKGNQMCAEFYDQVARYVLSNRKYREFAENFKFDISKYARQIYEETGYRIPDYYIDYAERLIKSRLARLKGVMKQLEHERGEKEDESGLML